MDIKQLRKEAVARAVSNEIQRLADEHLAIVTAAIRMDNRKTGAAIDTSMARPKLSTERAVTRQTIADRRSLFDHAETNPVLAKLLRQLQARRP